jgi:hypothetical protein
VSGEDRVGGRLAKVSDVTGTPTVPILRPYALRIAADRVRWRHDDLHALRPLLDHPERRAFVRQRIFTSREQRLAVSPLRSVPHRTKCSPHPSSGKTACLKKAGSNLYVALEMNQVARQKQKPHVEWDELYASTDFRELFRYKRGRDLVIYHLRPRPNGTAALWVTDNMVDRSVRSTLDATFNTPEDAILALEARQEALTRGGWKKLTINR